MHVIRLPRAAACRTRANIMPVTIELCNFPVKWAFFPVISWNTVVVTTLAKSDRRWFPLSPLNLLRSCVEVWISFLPLLAPKRFSSYNLSFWNASLLSAPPKGVSNGLTEFKSARKIWPLLELLAKIRWVLACSCSQNFCYCSHARIFVKISLWKNVRAMNVSGDISFILVLPTFYWNWHKYM